MMIDINQNPVLCPYTNKTNISIFLPISGPTVSFQNPLWFAIYDDRGSNKDAMKNSTSIHYML